LRIRRIVATCVILGGGLIGIALLASLGQQSLSLAFAVVVTILVLLPSLALRATRGRRLDRAAALAVWLSQQGFIDQEGRLTETGASRFDQLAAQGRLSADPVRHRDYIALSAYGASAKLAGEGRKWVDPMADALGVLDDGQPLTPR
jgi:hypothetical protein